MEQQTLTRSLEGLGLNKKEAAIYLAALTLESATAYRIAEVARLKRPTVYVVLDELRRKGLVLKTPHPKKALFSARSPAEYLAEERYRLELVERLLPQFEALRKQPGTAVYFYSGLAGMTDALNYRFGEMRENTFLSFYSNISNMSPALTTLYDEWDVKAIQAGIRFKVLRASGQKQELSHLTSRQQQSIEERYVKVGSYPTSISFEVADTFIRITDAEKLFATIIESPATAHALRLIFTLLWETASEQG